jgi:hypothetical protein
MRSLEPDGSKTSHSQTYGIPEDEPLAEPDGRLHLELLAPTHPLDVAPTAEAWRKLLNLPAAARQAARRP